MESPTDEVSNKLNNIPPDKMDLSMSNSKNNQSENDKKEIVTTQSIAIINKAMPQFKQGSKLVFIQNPNATTFSQTSTNGQQFLLSTVPKQQQNNSTVKTVPLNTPLFIPTSLTGNKFLIQQTKKPITNLVPIHAIPTSNGNKQLTYINNPVLTCNLPVNIVPMQANQKFITVKPIQNKIESNSSNSTLPNLITIPATISTTAQFQSKNKISVGKVSNCNPTVVEDVETNKKISVDKIPPLQPITKNEEVKEVVEDKEYTLSIPEVNNGSGQFEASFGTKKIITMNSDAKMTRTENFLVKNPPRINEEQKRNASLNKSKVMIMQNYPSVKRMASGECKFENETSVNSSRQDYFNPPKKHHAASILKKSRQGSMNNNNLQDADWKKSRIDFVSILKKKPEIKSETSMQKVVVDIEEKCEIKEEKLENEAVVDEQQVIKLEEIKKPNQFKAKRKETLQETVLKDDDIEFSAIDTSPISILKEVIEDLSNKSNKNYPIDYSKKIKEENDTRINDFLTNLNKIKDSPPLELYKIDDFDPVKVLEWSEDCKGSLLGSNIKFFINEFGYMQMATDDEQKITSSSSFKDISNTYISSKKLKKNVDSVCCCEVCGSYGYSDQFINALFCSYSCLSKFKEDDKKKKNKKCYDVPNGDHHIILNGGSRGQSPVPSDDNNTNDTIGSLSVRQPTYPWINGKKGFSWSKYLIHVNSKAAPLKLFKDPFPYNRNGFKTGMRLEGIDPQHPSNFCVLSVAEVLGYRIRCHFEGYSEEYDFWVNADSVDIFPAGWCEKFGHKLQPPKNFDSLMFNWNNFIKQKKVQLAPKVLFTNRSSPCPHGFRLHMKLEAVDRKNQSLICVATVRDIMDNRFLVHFDSWGDIYDYWADPTSPYIHPVGWCEEKGYSLTPPTFYEDPNEFNWDEYLKRTKTQPVPARAFKQRPPNGFKPGMRLECVDKRVPRLIRVATVDEVRAHQIRIKFDGWPDKYSYWVDDDSPDIHPCGWCQKSGHPLQPPLTPEDIYNSSCLTPGCQGYGNIKGPHILTHDIVDDCPYSNENYDKEFFKDRLVNDLKLMKPLEVVPLSKQPKRHVADSTTFPNLPPSSTNNNIDVDKQLSISSSNNLVRKQEHNHHHHHNHRTKQSSPTLFSDDDNEKWRAKYKGRKRKISKHSSNGGGSSSSSSDYDSSVDLNIVQSDQEVGTTDLKNSFSSSDDDEDDDDDKPRTTQYTSSQQHSRYTKTGKNLTTNKYNDDDDDNGNNDSLADPNKLPPFRWDLHSQNLFLDLNDRLLKNDPRHWSEIDVVDFVNSIPSCREHSSLFNKHQIDGEALLMLSQNDLTSILGFKLGPAVKLYNTIILLRHNVLNNC